MKQRLREFLRTHFHSGRGGRAKLAISTSLLSRLIATGTSFLVLPITIRYLGNEGYGLLTTISSVVAWLQFTNMGIGLGLQNALTEEYAKADTTAQRELVSTAVFALLGIGSCLALLGSAIFPIVNWLAVFPPTSGRFTTEIPWAVLIVFIGFVSTIVLGFLIPLYAARQELHITSVQTVITSFCSLGALLGAVHLRVGLSGIIVATIGVPALTQWSFALWTLFGRGLPDLRPRWSVVSRPAWQRIYKNGLSFLAVQICNIVYFQADAFLISHLLSTDQVTPYSVAQKVFIQTTGMFALVTGSLWGAYGHAKAQRDFVWIKRTHRKMVRVFLTFFGLVSVFMILFGHRLLSRWVGPEAAPPTLLIASVALYFCAREWTSLHAMLLNGLDVIRPQVTNIVITAVITLVLDVILIHHLGAMGLALGGCLGFSIGSAWYLPYLTSKALRTDESVAGIAPRVSV